MHEVDILIISFVVLNVLDGISTYISLRCLPTEIRAEEANPLLKDIEGTPWLGLVRKAMFVIVGLWIFLTMGKERSILVGLKAIDMVLVFTVVNNFYVYITRRIKKYKTQTLIEWIQKTLHLPKFVAFYGLITILTVLSYVYVLNFWS